MFPRLIQDRSKHDPVRIWTLGCSTGQEAYSLAMAFREAAGMRDSARLRVRFRALVLKDASNVENSPPSIIGFRGKFRILCLRLAKVSTVSQSA